LCLSPYHGGTNLIYMGRSACPSRLEGTLTYQLGGPRGGGIRTTVMGSREHGGEARISWKLYGIQCTGNLRRRAVS
jgi:hypothetical protein